MKGNKAIIYRQKQEYRDKIHELGLNYRIQVNKMERI
jgi:hypothetical protein